MLPMTENGALAMIRGECRCERSEAISGKVKMQNDRAKGKIPNPKPETVNNNKCSNTKTDFVLNL